MIGDPNFERTVVLVLEHSLDDGAIGLVLNRPSDIAVEDPLPEWDQLVAQPPVVFVGGPVEPAAAIALARLALGRDRDDADEGWSRVLGPIGTLDLGLRPDDLPLPVEEMRVFAGYAGWGPGQLEAELDADAWLVVDGFPADVLDADPERLWRRVLHRQGGDVALLALYPTDPTAN